MRYLLLLCSDVDSGGTGEMPGCGGWTEELLRSGVLTDVAGLRPPDTATSVRVRGDQVLLTDGPFAETKDQIGGFSVLECADLDEAVRLAAAHPWAGYGQIEIRPIADGLGRP